ncbi:unnamed protein product [Nippostrongylus brasiliensis]|uniref:Zinc transporter ZIP13 (inferred by orthology to a human protein) n=1 Tax=Nippostrongylus brasiliensis TaxID=27835 RepID=A0A0N4Y023_NIPBR|nr:hypothetical protein Q1695_000167 [Nippostrongylus brasiliensis]VDL72429.1 unnamed protein product [Nippostrongylus brasiliensis]
MRWSVFPALIYLASCQDFHIGHNHPAAGPDTVDMIASKLDPKDSLQSEILPPEGLIDPDGRQFIAPLRQKTQQIEKELRQEAETISQLLSKDESRISLSVLLGSMVGCCLVVLSGILPALFMPANSSQYLQTEEGKRRLNMLLSFAVGSLLGDVFLHLLPATWEDSNGTELDFYRIGLCTIAGLLICLFIEKLCSTTEESQHKICAIMNLAANLVDNFTHGLAIGASFTVSPKFGMMTTFAILVHEIPHEVSDFAILLRADFDRLQAVKAQFVTASGGIAGAAMALWMRSDFSDSVDWILPFTAGGFINIALCQILPELNRENDRRQNCIQLLMVLIGMSVMIAVSQMHVA